VQGVHRQYPPEEFEAFPFFLDRGCSHAVRRQDVRAYLRTLQVTVPGSVGLVLAGNARDPHEPGKGLPEGGREEGGKTVRNRFGSISSS
jgi:hypothetical protein